MKKNYFLFFVGFSLLTVLAIYGINWIFEGRKYCSVQELLLSESEYPPNTIFDIALSPIDEKPRESASRSSYYYESWIRENVIMYRSTSKAYEIFIDQRDSLFDSSEIYDEWKTPLRLGIDNISADQYHNGCGDVRYMGYRCIFLAQYEAFIVLFSVDISSNGITEEIFRDLVLKIDEKIFACINN